MKRDFLVFMTMKRWTYKPLWTGILKIRRGTTMSTAKAATRASAGSVGVEHFPGGGGRQRRQRHPRGQARLDRNGTTSTIITYKTRTTTGWCGGGRRRRRRHPTTNGSAAWWGGEGGGGGGDDGDYYDLPHVRRAAARPMHRIRHSEVDLVDAPLDDGRRKRIRRMGIDIICAEHNRFLLRL